MNARLIVVCVCVILISASGSWAGDIVEASGSVASASVTVATAVGALGDEGPIGPWIHPKISSGTRDKL